jgi:hypothetical protein
MKVHSVFKAIAAITLMCAAFISCSKENGKSGSDGNEYAGQYGIFISTNETLDPSSYEMIVRNYMEKAINDAVKDLKDVFRNSSNDLKVVEACDLIYENEEIRKANPGKSFTVVLFFKEDNDDSIRQTVKRYDYLSDKE